MRSIASVATITMLSVLLMGCYDASKDQITLVTPKGYSAPTAILRPSWEEKLAFQTGAVPSDTPQVPLVLAPKEVAPAAPAVAAAPAGKAAKKVAMKTHRSRRGLVRASHKRKGSSRRQAIVAER